MKLNVNIEIYNNDCLNAMQWIDDKSIDLILCDLPYGTTNCKWDSIIPFEPLWNEYKRIIKPNGAIVLFSSQPFTSALISTNYKWFKYEWIWIKNCATKFVHAHSQPMKKQENICVFYNQKPTYNPQGLIRVNKIVKPSKSENKPDRFIKQENKKEYIKEFTNYPTDVLYFDIDNNKNRLHPTQKPVELLEYLIKTYSNENDVVLDNCLGSGSTGVAAINTNRKFIGIEKDEHYFNVSLERLNKTLNQKLNNETNQ